MLDHSNKSDESIIQEDYAKTDENDTEINKNIAEIDEKGLKMPFWGKSVNCWNFSMS